MAFQAGDLLDDRYEIVAKIGEGGHGWVYRATDRELASEVVVKVLRPEMAGDAALVARMQREARAMGQLSGTSAVQVLAFNCSPSAGTYLVMEHLSGWDLQQYLERYEKDGKRMPVAEMLEILDPIASTLEAAHVRKIVHRDLKLANIFVLKSRARGRVRLHDFGLVKDLKAPTVTLEGTVAGSPSYIAPEAWRGKPEQLDHRIDVYSFGVVVFRVLAGRLPFDPSPSIAQTILDVTTRPRPRLTPLRPDLPAKIDDWVRTALAVDPAERFQSMQALWFVLEGILKS
ncbi:MAG: serine/threonine protein kinase [Deltaproteobacteria bacterium]|nr:serine/threonine protein kinase [Deltaproteobacteria bacterium]